MFNKAVMENGDIIRCAQCGHENPRKNIFCGICGSRLTQQSQDDRENITLEDLTEIRLLSRALEGKFEILEELGRGGFGVVFKARDIQLERLVAIKALHLTKSGDQSLVKRFIKEARLSAKLEHPNIARIYTIDSAALVHYFIMEFIEGPTIKDWLNERGVFSPYHVVKFGKDIARALAFAHKKGIIHRDIKPANVILKNEETAVVTDFGIAKALWSEATALTNGAIGTPIYMAPEQFRGADLDGRADMYALGILFYEMLTGEPPFIAAGAMLIQQQLYSSPPPLTQRNPDVPESLVKIINRLLAKDPDDRYRDCDELYDVLDTLDISSLPRECDLPTVGITLDALPVEQLIQDGKTALLNKQYDAALDMFNSARELDPDNVDVLFLIEQARLKKENREKLEARIKEGIANFHDGKYTQAIQIWSEALQFDKQNEEIPKLIEQARRRKDATNRGQELKQEGLKALQQQRYDTAIHKFSSAKNFLGTGEELDRLIKKAQEEKKEFTRIQSLLDKASDLRKRRKYADALTVYRQILELDPDQSTARNLLERTLEEQKRFYLFHQMEQKWRRMAKEGRFNKVIAEIDESLTKFPEFKDRIINLKARINLERQHANGIIRLAAQAQELHEKGLYEEAQKIWEQIREQDPDHPILQSSAILTERELVQKKLKQMQKQESGDIPGHSEDAFKAEKRTFSEQQKKDTGKRYLHRLRWMIPGALVLLIAAGVFWSKSNPTKSDGASFIITPTQSRPTKTPPSPISGTNLTKKTPSAAPSPTQPRPVFTSVAIAHRNHTPTPTASSIPISPTKTPSPPTSTPHPRHSPTPRPATSSHTLPTGAQVGRLINTARSLADEKHYRKALRIIDDILIVAPGHNAALLMKRELEDILERSRNMMQVARQVAREGRKSEADKIVDRVLELDPFNPEATAWKQHGGLDESGTVILNVQTRPKSFKANKPVNVLVTVKSKYPVKKALLHFRNARGEWEHLSVYKELKLPTAQRFQLVFNVPGRGVSRIGLSVYVTIIDKNGKHISKGRAEDPIFFFAGR